MIAPTATMSGAKLAGLAVQAYPLCSIFPSGTARRSNRMRIGVDARLMYYQPAGISRYTWHLLQALAELDSEDEFIVFQQRNHKTPLIQQANFRRATLFAPVHHRLEQSMLMVELMRFRLDLLHSTDFIPPLYSPVNMSTSINSILPLALSN